MIRSNGILRRIFVFCALFLILLPILRANIANLRDMVRKNPNDIRLQFLLGKAYSQKGQHLKAKRIFQNILQRKRAPVVFLHLGLELASMGNITGAILQWTSVIEQKPNNMTTMRLLARALHKQALLLSDERDQADLFEQSLGWWKRILHLDPGNLRARYYAGIECYKLSRYEEAAKHWLILLRVKKNNRKTLKALGKALIKLGKIQSAKKVARRVLAIERRSGRTGYTSWAQKLISLIDSGDIKKPRVKREEETLPREMEETEPLKKEPRYVVQDLEKKKSPREPKPVDPSTLPGGNLTDEAPGSSIRAEELFLDGLDYMDQSKYEKALFAFLQSIDINPEFIQVYLQMGECYIRLARLAKRKTQFLERLSLAKQSLEKVQEKSPASLVSHAAQSKLVIVEKLLSSGFKGYHIMTAHEAIKEKREDDAFDEYILLLSNMIIEPGVFLELGAIVNKISKSNRQDLQYFTEDLYQQNPEHPWIEYLLGKIYSSMGKEKEALDAFELFLKHFSPKADTKTFATYVKFVDHPSIQNLDRYLCVRLLMRIDKEEEAFSLLKTFLRNANSNAIFYKEANLLVDQLQRRRSSDTTERITFFDEKKELIQSVSSARVLFDSNLSPSHLDESLQKNLQLFIEKSPNNTLGRFVFAWILGTRSQTASSKLSSRMSKRSEEIFQEILTEKTTSAKWHFTMGIQALLWHLKDRGLAHLKLVGDILVSQGIPNSSKYCNNLLIEAERFEISGKPEIALALLRQAKAYSPRSLNYYLVRSWVEFNRGDLLASLGQIIDWGSNALYESWVRKIVFCDFALILFLSILATILATATALTIKHFELLHHFFIEFVSTKGAFLTLGLGAMAAVFLFSFSTGIIVFLPAVLWPLMGDKEKVIYLLLVSLLLLIPLLLPLSLFQNFELIRQVENVRSGALDEASEFFDSAVSENSSDFALNYAHGLILLRQERLEEAKKVFEKLLKQGERESLLINLGIIAARLGNYDNAISYFQKALSIEAKSVPALYDIAVIHAFEGRQDKSEQYMRWAKALATESDQLSRYRAVPSYISKLVLMDSSLDTHLFSSHFSFFSTDNFFQLNANLIGFITWFIIGGGLIGFLIFLREQMDIVLSRCSQCYKATCNLCQQVVQSRAYCENCSLFEESNEGREVTKSKRQTAANEARDLAVKKAFGSNTLLPCTGPLFTGDPIPSVLCQLGFWFCFQATNGGWLLTHAFSSGPGSDVLVFFSWLFCAGALFFYLLGFALLYQWKESIEWI